MVSYYWSLINISREKIEESEAICSEVQEILLKLERCLSNINKDGEQGSAGSPSINVTSGASGVSSVSSSKLPKANVKNL